MPNITATITFRNDTAANWVSTNPVLAAGEPGVEHNTGKMKVGDGVTAWNGLGYFQGDTGPAGATGATGPQGAAGNDGAQGPQGLQGDTGPQGPAGSDGVNGSNGAAGADGQSAYQLAVAQGFVGDEAAWLASLVGPQGPAGSDGATGPTGATGATGAQGPAGNDGAIGPQGPAGNNGAQGIQGETGPTGATGPAGPQGDTGPQGSTGATGPTEWITPIWAEENANLGNNAFEWAFGNGANSPSNTGISIYVPTGFECHIVAMSATTNNASGSSLIEAHVNGAAIGASDGVEVQLAGRSATNDSFTPYALSSADRLTFRTRTAGTNSGPSTVAAWLRYRTV